MKNLYISNYNLETIYDTGVPFSYKVLDTSNYNLEVIYSEALLVVYKYLYLSNYNIELLHPYVEVDTSKVYYLKGIVNEYTTPIVREVLSFNQKTLFLDTNVTTTSSGTFLLNKAVSDTCFLICKDDIGGQSYNNLIISSMVPYLSNTYGFIENNPGLSAFDIKQKNPAASFNGIYWIKPIGYAQAIQVYCDMTTQGGGWTMCARWDRDFPTGWIPCLPTGALRSNINVVDMIYTSTQGTTQTSTINIIPLITAGASMFMHVSLDIYDTVWKYIYFSEIYQAVIDNPDNIFNVATFDTNYVMGGGVVGSVVNGSAVLKNRWFNNNMVVSYKDTNGSTSNNYYLNGGEGNAMFTNGGRPGAVYSMINYSDCRATPSTPVFWCFYGKDGSTQDYMTSEKDVRIGAGTASFFNCRFNFMFIR